VTSTGMWSHRKRRQRAGEAAALEAGLQERVEAEAAPWGAAPAEDSVVEG
jgi:hypothetical protein